MYITCLALLRLIIGICLSSFCLSGCWYACTCVCVIHTMGNNVTRFRISIDVSPRSMFVDNKTHRNRNKMCYNMVGEGMWIHTWCNTTARACLRVRVRVCVPKLTNTSTCTRGKSHTSLHLHTVMKAPYPPTHCCVGGNFVNFVIHNI